ncbi:radical SAM protein [Myxococcus stipitatus]|uniref:radical SAM/SPASM domain-containing protein n=1 Tax=Myxococcus stipitatus TaxID=83455 RepID=UPI0031456D77
MEWSPNIETLYSKIVAQVPMVFRPIVKPKLREAAEAQSRHRNESWVSEEDLVAALFEITPKQFKDECVNMVKGLGLDAARFVDLNEIRNQYKKSWAEFGEAFLPGNYHITLYVTDRCNEQCKHCAIDLFKRDDLPIKDWIHIQDNLEGALRKQGRRGVYIYFGGEPTVRKDLRELIAHAGKNNYFQALATNGLLFNDDYAKFCAENGMSHVFVSLDSADPQKAAKIRGAKRAGDLARRAIENAQKYGMFVIVNFVVMKQNIDEMESMKTLIESWGAAPYMRAVIKTGTAAQYWKEVGLSPEEYRRFYDFKYRHAIEAVRKGLGSTLPIFDIWDWTPFMEQPRTAAERTAIEWGVGCQSCRTISGVDVNGDLFPCYYPTQLKLGNLLEQRFEDIMETQVFKDIRDRKKNSGKCTSCGNRQLCGGGCGVHSECETGDFFASVPYCWHKE